MNNTSTIIVVSVYHREQHCIYILTKNSLHIDLNMLSAATYMSHKGTELMWSPKIRNLMTELPKLMLSILVNSKS